MTGFKSKKAAALDEDGMYLVHQTAQPAHEPVAWKESDEVECPVCKNKGFPWPKCGHITYLERTPPQREWVDLTPQDLNEIFAIAMTGEHAVHLASDKLKEKNNG